ARSFLSLAAERLLFLANRSCRRDFARGHNHRLRLTKIPALPARRLALVLVDVSPGHRHHSDQSPSPRRSLHLSSANRFVFDDRVGHLRFTENIGRHWAPATP